jgi:hypothetical protein
VPKRLGEQAGRATLHAPVIPAAQTGIWAVFLAFWPSTRPYRGRLLLSLLLVAIGPFLDTAQIWILQAADRRRPGAA